MIAFIINSLDVGGTQKVCVAIANELAKRGQPILLLVIKSKAPGVQRFIHSGVQVRVIGASNVRTSALAIARMLRAHGVTTALAFGHQIGALLVYLRWFRIWRGRVVVRCMNTLSAMRAAKAGLWQRHISYWLFGLTKHKLDLVIAQSEGMAHDLRAGFGIDPHRLRVIRNPIELQHKVEIEQREPITRSGILFVGRLDRVKRVDLLLQAFALFLSRTSSSNHPVLHIVGDGPLKASLHHLVEELSLEGSVVFVGYRNDVAAFYRRSKVVVLTSEYEGFPNVLLEAMSYGTPVVSVDCPSGPADIIRSGINGFLVSDDSPAAIAAALERAITFEWNEEEIRRSIAPYSLAEIADEYDALLYEIESRP